MGFIDWLLYDYGWIVLLIMVMIFVDRRWLDR